MDFITKKTNELSKDELQQLKDLFEEVFERPTSIEGFLKNYTSNYLGYSYHTLIIKDNRIVGSNSLVPINYYIDGRIFRFVNSGGTMIGKSCRGIENFYDMIKESYRNAESEGFIACTGFPNDNSYPLFKGIKLMKDIGKMHTYMLPCRIGGIKKKLVCLNLLSKMFCWCYVTVCGLIASKGTVNFKIHKDHGTFDDYRYKKAEDAYVSLNLGKGKAYYRVANHEGVRTAFIVDITEKSAKNFQCTVKEIMKRERKNMDLILYVGNLPFGNHGLIKVPRKYEPKNFNFTGHIFNEKLIDKSVFFDINNWDVNLSNYDLI